MVFRPAAPVLWARPHLQGDDQKQMSQDRFGIVGKIIARTYEIRKVVAEGGFGVVYRAYHRGFRAEAWPPGWPGRDG